jgi:hypothetical protein
MVLPGLAVLAIQPLLLRGLEVGNVGAGLGDEVDVETSGAEDVEGVEGFGYEEACVVGVVRREGYGKGREGCSRKGGMLENGKGVGGREGCWRMGRVLEEGRDVGGTEGFWRNGGMLEGCWTKGRVL